MDWAQIELFKGIDLNDSFVLNWTHEDNKFSFELEASIWSESEHYSKSKDDEYTYYRKATLMFTKVQSINGLKPIDFVPSTKDRDGTTD